MLQHYAWNLISTQHWCDGRSGTGMVRSNIYAANMLPPRQVSRTSPVPSMLCTVFHPPQSRSFVKHFWHVAPVVGMILQLLCCPIVKWNWQKTKQNMTTEGMKRSVCAWRVRGELTGSYEAKTRRGLCHYADYSESNFAAGTAAGCCLMCSVRQSQGVLNGIVSL